MKTGKRLFSIIKFITCYKGYWQVRLQTRHPSSRQTFPPDIQRCTTCNADGHAVRTAESLTRRRILNSGHRYIFSSVSPHKFISSGVSGVQSLLCKSRLIRDALWILAKQALHSGSDTYNLTKITYYVKQNSKITSFQDLKLKT